MFTISLRLSDEDKDKLAQLLAATRAKSQSDLIRKLINDQWVALQAGATFIQRRGGPPEHLLSDGTLSGRKKRKAALAKHFKDKAAKRRRST